MHSVSADYLTALSQPVHKYRLSGTVGTEAFNQSNIISGSLSITNKVSEGSEIKLGSVYTGELRATFTGLSIARGSWVGKKITLSEGLQLADESFEDVPLGVFTIAEATHKADGVSVVAYDAMTAFDKTRNDLTETGTAYDFLSLMCQKCGVTLGMTSADVAALTNGTETLSIYSENDIETWRDLLSWVAQTLCSVATINRAGELELRQYSVSSAATIDETHRFTGCSFSDFTTYYTGMSVVNIALRQTEYKSVTPDDGLTYNLGSNPLVQGDYDLVQNIIDDFSNVQLVPFSAQMLGGAIYDLCDCLTFSGGIAAGAVCGVMGYTWKYNGAYAVNGFGSNPALATAKSKAQKDIDAIYNTIGEEINQMSVVQNSSSVTCGENTETSILTYNFEVTQEENTTMADVSVVMTSSASETEVGDVYTLSDIVAHLSFYVDGSEVNVYAPEFIVDEGKDTMTFNYSLSGLSVGAHQFDVRLTMDGGSGSIAVGDVHEMLWGYGITFEVYVKSIEIVSLPTKTTFASGSVFNWSGLQVNANYNNGVEEDVTGDCTITPASGTTASTPGEQEVTVTYVDSSQIEYEESFSVVVTDFANCFVINDYFTSDSNIHRFDADSDDVIANVPSINGFLATENDIWYKDSSGIQTIINGSIKKILGNVSYSTFACDDGCATVGSPYQNTDGKYQFDCAFAKGNLADGITETKALFSVVRSETIRPTYKNPGNTAYRHYKHFIPLLLDVYNSSTHRTTVEYGYYDLDREELVDGWKTSMVSSSLNGYWRTTHIFTDDAEYFYINYANVRYMHVYKDGEHQWFDISSISSLGTGGTDVVPKLYYDKTNSCLVLFLMTYAPATECIKLNLDGHTVIGNVSLPQYLDVAFEDSDPYDHARVWINTSASSASGQFDIYAYSVLGDAHWFWWFDENGEVASPQNILGSYSNPSSLTDHFAINIDNLYLQSSSGNFARRYTT